MTASILIFGSGLSIGFMIGLVAALAVRPEAATDDEQHECVKGNEG